MEAIVNHYIQQYQQAKPYLAGTAIPWLAALREEAVSQFAQQGLPHQRLEAWKYTSIKPLLKQAFTIDPRRTTTSITQAQIDPYLLPDTLPLIFIDGVFAPQYSLDNTLLPEVILGSLYANLNQYPDKLAPYFTAELNHGLHGFSALNTSLMNDGACLILPPNCQIAKPIQLLYLQSKAGHSSQLFNLIILGENSTATIIEHYLGLTDTCYFTNTVSQVFIQPHASLKYYKIQEESFQASHIGLTKIQQQQHSQVTTHSYAIGSLLARSDIQLMLLGPEARCNSYGFYQCKQYQLLDQHTQIDHLSPACRSQESYKGIIDHHAKGVFNGKIIVHPNAQQSDAHLANHNILLSDQAEIDTKPELEIYADDVKCTHGATVGQLSPEVLFYLRSRGLDDLTARNLLLDAFAAEMLELIEINTVKAYLQHRLFLPLLQKEG